MSQSDIDELSRKVDKLTEFVMVLYQSSKKQAAESDKRLFQIEVALAAKANRAESDHADDRRSEQPRRNRGAPKAG